VFHAGRGPCYRCVFPVPPPAGAIPNCAEGGVLGVLPGIVGNLLGGIQRWALAVDSSLPTD